MELPTVGDSVVVRHVTRQNKAGVARLVQESPKVSFVKSVYPLGWIKTEGGDVFRITTNQETKSFPHVKYMTME